MAISESQFQTWSRQGSTGSAASLYERISRTLKVDVDLSKHSFEVFLQGSYRNSTNIHGESDVDVVAMLTESYKPEYSALGVVERQRLEAASIPASYNLFNFRQDVSKAIRRAFSNHSITEGGKSIKIPRTPYNIPADVVPCIEYRIYSPSNGLLTSNQTSISGIWLRDERLNAEVVSFPKQHYENGVARNFATNEWYKPIVRIFKNSRCWLVDHDELTENVATSFQIESLLYNVPTHLYGTSYQNSFINILVWLNKADLSCFTCQNGIQLLFEDGRWATDKAKTYLNALTKMYLEWGKGNALLRFG